MRRALKIKNSRTATVTDANTWRRVAVKDLAVRIPEMHDHIRRILSFRDFFERQGRHHRSALWGITRFGSYEAWIEVAKSDVAYFCRRCREALALAAGVLP
jgi:hypothetical protein